MKRTTALIFFLLLGCSESDKEQYMGVINVPILDGCVDEVMDHFKQSTNDTGTIILKYHPFNYTLMSHPGISGYISISSKYEKAEDMEPYFNALQFTCHPTTSQKFDFTTEGIEDFSKNLKSWQQLGMKTAYITIKEGKISMLFNRNNFLQSNKSLKTGTPHDGAP